MDCGVCRLSVDACVWHHTHLSCMEAKSLGEAVGCGMLIYGTTVQVWVRDTFLVPAPRQSNGQN